MTAQHNTPVSVAYEAIKAYLGLNEESDREALEFVHAQIAQVWTTTKDETRREIAARLDGLGNGRLEYVGRPLPANGDEIEMLGGMRGSIYGEATGAKWLARIIRGETDDRGWLPSWRWGQS